MQGLRSDVIARITSQCTYLARGRADTHGRSGPLACDHALIDEDIAVVGRALESRRFGSLHVAGGDCGRLCPRGSPTAAATDWSWIVGLYDALLQGSLSPVVELNRAVAVAMRDGLLGGLMLIDAILSRGLLEGYDQLLIPWAARWFRALDDW